MLSTELRVEIDEVIHIPKLSICIATYNRGKFISETLESILPQLCDNVELLILDGASPDNTRDVVFESTKHIHNVKYIRESINSGVDRDYDKVVGYAKGKYCWLMTDDDLLHPDAVRRVLRELDKSPELVVVNAEVKNVDFSKTLTERQLNITVDQTYNSLTSEQFFYECIGYLSFIGGIVISRDVWMSRDREKYYGTLFIHIGVIFQGPPIVSVHVISDPLVIIRYGNAMWTGKMFEIWAFKWPNLVWSFGSFSDEAKRRVCQFAPWKNIKTLIYYRAAGAYSTREYEMLISNKTPLIDKVLPKIIAHIPGQFLVFISMLILTFFKTRVGTLKFDLVHSKYTNSTLRFFARTIWK